MGKPLAAGLALLALGSAATGYFATLLAWRAAALVGQRRGSRAGRHDEKVDARRAAQGHGGSAAGRTRIDSGRPGSCGGRRDNRADDDCSV